MDMDRAPRRGCDRGSSSRKPRRAGPAMRFWAHFAAAVILAACLPQPVAAQQVSAPSGAQPSAAKQKPKPAKPGGASAAVPARDGAASPTGGGEPDVAYAAFQRGDFLTAFKLATKRIEDKSDVKAMTLLGELYANGLGVPQDDAKAAEWYKLAADRGDANATFALAMFRISGRAGPRDRDASAKLLAAA